MTEILQNAYFSYENPRLKWELAFMKTAKISKGHAEDWVNTGVNSGMVANNSLDRNRFARDMGRVFSLAFIQETGGQLPVENLDFTSLSKETHTPVERYKAVAGIMLQVGVLHSVKERVKNPTFV